MPTTDVHLRCSEGHRWSYGESIVDAGGHHCPRCMRPALRVEADEAPAPRCLLCRHWHLYRPGRTYIRGCGVYSDRPEIADDVNTWWWEHSPASGAEPHDPQDPVCPGFERREEGEHG